VPWASANTLGSDEDCAAARQLVIHGVMAGLSTAGELIDRVERLDTADRRVLLHAARQLAGLESIDTVDGRRRFEAATAGRQDHRRGRVPLADMPRPKAATPSLRTRRARPLRSTSKRWWCPAHVDQAAEGDMQPRPSRLRYSESGAIVQYDPIRRARDAAREESHRRAAEERRADDAAAPSELREHEQAMAEAHRRELPQGFALRPNRSPPTRPATPAPQCC
jgi:hypothetical protein